METMARLKNNVSTVDHYSKPSVFLCENYIKMPTDFFILKMEK